jgi:hypothetical protein
MEQSGQIYPGNGSNLANLSATILKAVDSMVQTANSFLNTIGCAAITSDITVFNGYMGFRCSVLNATIGQLHGFRLLKLDVES